MPTDAPLSTVLRQATARLAAAGVATPRADVTALLALVLETDASEVHRLSLLGRGLPAQSAPRFASLLERRCRREPLQHLTGRAPFRRLEVEVGPGVFVPRPETEVVAGVAVDELRRRIDVGEAPTAVDLCTGSAAIALALADEAPGACVHAVELSDEALVWARRNVEMTGLPVSLHADDVTGDLPSLRALRGRVAVVVSNPPYIPPEAVPVDVEVAEHDPRMALYGGGIDGLEVPRAVVDAAAALLAEGGLLVMEHADVQSAALVEALSVDPRWREVTPHADLTGRPRLVSARRAGIPSLGS